MGTATTEQIKTMAPGIYFNLDEDTYHEDPSLGSSDIGKLARNAADYWYGSFMNPARPAREDTPATIRGTAVHVQVLYGMDEFKKRYMRGPDQDGMTPGQKGASTKKANEEAAARGLIGLKATLYDNIAVASAMIAKNPNLAKALVGGFNEVSVFYRDKRGIPKKARFDCLKPRGIGDLKSRVNILNKPFGLCCLDTIRYDRKDIQAQYYLQARAMLPQLAKAGAVFGDYDKAAFQKVIDAKEWAWQWVWWQAEGAPITYSKIASPDNPMFEKSRASITRAEDAYLFYLKNFGLNEPWLPQDVPEEISLEDDLGAYFGKDF